MANTYNFIDSITVGAGGATTMTFSSIPQTFTDLMLYVSVRNNTSAYFYALSPYLNSDTTNANYYRTNIYGYTSGTNPVSSPAADANWLWQNNPQYSTTIWASNSLYIPNYTGSNNRKLIQTEATVENNGDRCLVIQSANYWTSTNAVTSITLTSVNNMDQYSTAYLYGIKNS